LKLSKAWIVATKDFSVFRTKKNIIYSIVLFPLLASTALPLVVHFTIGKHYGIPRTALPPVLNAFAFFFVIGAASLPTAIASYSLVGEKVERSLEPLLATPATDGEVLLGKSFAAFLLPMAAIYGGATIFMALMDTFTYGILGYLYFPNWSIGVVLLMVAPLAAMLCIGLNVIVSSRINDVRAAQQLGGLTVLPFAGIYLAGQIDILPLSTSNLLVISAVLSVIDLVLFYFSTTTFRREEILTKWK